MLALVLTCFFELVDVLSKCIAKPFRPVIAIAVTISQTTADFRSHCLLFGGRLVRVFATVRIVAAR